MPTETLQLNPFQERLLSIPEDFDVFLGVGAVVVNRMASHTLLCVTLNNTESKRASSISAKATRDSQTLS
jgi:hypothetical protein